MAGSIENQKTQESTQLNILPRVASVYRTVSTKAIKVLTGYNRYYGTRKNLFIQFWKGALTRNLKGNKKKIHENLINTLG